MNHAQEERAIAKAIRILEGRLQKTETAPLADTTDVSRYCVARFAARPAECFAVMFLNTRGQLIECRELFQGTIDSAFVHTREVVRAVIETNAHSVILVHNHPSGNPDPSAADIAITAKIAAALATIDVRVLDHMIVNGVRTTSLLVRGRMPY